MRHRFCTAKRQQQAHFRIVQNGGLSRGVFFDAVRAERRVNRNGNRAGKENARVGNEKCPRRGQHHRHATACRHAAARKLVRDALPRRVKLAERQGQFACAFFGILADQQMRALGIMRGAEAQHIDQRLRALERRLETAGSRSAASAAQAVDHVGESVASALSSIAENLRGRANSMRDEVAKIGGDAAKLGDQALRRLAGQVEHRPLVTLAVAVAVGILVGLASHPRASRPTRAPVRRRH